MAAMPNELLTLSATELARRIRTQRVSSREVVDEHIRLVERDNPRTNAIIERRFTKARREADEVDRRVKEGLALPPLAGVPCTIKEALCLEGMHSTSGVVSRRHLIAGEDGVAVARYRAAGPIPIGTTNVSEILMWMESENRVYGRTSSAYDASRTAGGSSGGEGAAVGSGYAPIGLGSDVGGSIRIPAAFNGVFGHKPSGGLVPNAGAWPLPPLGAQRFLCTGPFARRAEDLEPLLRAIAGPHRESPEVLAMPIGDPSSVSMRGLRVLVVEDNGVAKVSREMRDALSKAAKHLESMGAHIEVAQFASLKNSVWIWASMLADADPHAASFAELLGNGQSIDVGHEFLRLLVGKSDHTFPALALAAIENVPKAFPAQGKALVEEGTALRKELATRIGDGVLLIPPYTSTAPKHRVPWRRPLDWAYTAIFNTMENPVTSVPLGLGEHGLPLGVQVVGRHFQDHRTLAVALELERAFGGWVPPKTLDA